MAKQPLDKSAATDIVHGQPAPARTISQALGVDPVLPGESSVIYQQGLEDLILELGAKTILQVYLVEKIYDCLWWIRRYEQQKRATIIAEMAAAARKGYASELSQAQIDLRESLLKNELDPKGLQTITSVGHSVESLRQAAMSRKRVEIQLLDNQIALQSKILAGLQASYEVVANRQRNIERFELQNAALRRDVGAIEAETDDQPKAKSRKSA